MAFIAGQTYYTDYPIKELGDVPFTEAPIRSVVMVKYDGDKYCWVRLKGLRKPIDIKAGYIYTEPRRFEDASHR